MKHVIIGTAGHIDHGKTSLVRTLTGRNTDRLEEEQKRGISIDLGFTYFDLPSGLRAGIIDVPGHEKFIKNMLAGVVGIDIVLLVIAADEGVMPQTVEHLNILDLMGVKRGIVVLTKSDMVESEWLKLVEEDVRQALKGTFLENSSILPMSSVSKKGMKEVIAEIDCLAINLEDTKSTRMPRMPIDRVFTVKGFGTVVTGTLLSGSLKIDDEIQIYPNEKKTKIRSIQVHDQSEQEAYAGQRVAINLPNIKKEEIHRGDVVAPVGSMVSTMMIDATFKLLGTIRSLKNRTRIRLYIGSKEVLGRIVLLEKDEMKSGEEALVQFRLEEEIVAAQGDRFIVRFYSPMFTIGGGEVIDANPKKRKRFDDEVISLLWERVNADEITNVESVIKEHHHYGISIDDLAVQFTLDQDAVLYILQTLLDQGKIYTFNVKSDVISMHRESYNQISIAVLSFLKDFHEKNPYREGVPKEELLNRFFKDKKSGVGDWVIYSMVSNEEIAVFNNILRCFDFFPKAEQHDSRKNTLFELLNSFRFNLIKYNDLLNQLVGKKKDEMKQWRDYLNLLLRRGDLIKLADDLIISNDMMEEGQEKLIQFCDAHHKITLAEYRDILETSRKPAMAMLDYFDENKVTMREEDYRILIKKEKEDGVENING